MNLSWVTFDRPKTGSAALPALRTDGCASFGSSVRGVAPAVRRIGVPSDRDVWIGSA